MNVIKTIGVTLVELTGNAYFQRRFCLLETFATVLHGGRCAIYSHVAMNAVHQIEESRGVARDDEDFVIGGVKRSIDVNLWAAQTRNPDDKAQIDKFIQESIGFEELDRKVYQVACESLDTWFRWTLR